MNNIERTVYVTVVVSPGSPTNLVDERGRVLEHSCFIEVDTMERHLGSGPAYAGQSFQAAWVMRMVHCEDKNRARVVAVDGNPLDEWLGRMTAGNAQAVKEMFLTAAALARGTGHAEVQHRPVAHADLPVPVQVKGMGPRGSA